MDGENRTETKAAHEHYQYKPFDGSSHSWALDKLSKLPNDAKVLDIGAGSGFAGSYLKHKGLTDVYAVEIEPQAAEHLRKIYKDVVPDIGHYQGMQFDTILLLDVLEHLPSPVEFLKSLTPYLAEKGTILISIPNIAHWSVRIPLLFGFFNYQDRGILDSTHLHFFTRASFKRFIKDSPFILTELNQTIVPFQLLLSDKISASKTFKFWTTYRKLFAKFLPGLCAYQNLAVLKHP